MSDDSRSGLGGPQPQPGYPEHAGRAESGIHEHWCEHPGCKRWGSFGFAAGRETKWFCGAHRPFEG